MLVQVEAVAMTAKEREDVVSALSSARERLRAETKLSEPQWRFRPAPNVWSPGDIVEHLVRSEQAVYQLVTAELVNRPLLPPRKRSRIRDIGVLMAVTNRDLKFTAAEMVQPKSQWASGANVLADFEKLRERSIEFMKSTSHDLRARTEEHPVLGVIDAYQWVLFLAAHSERHTEQLVDVKKAEGFPRA